MVQKIYDTIKSNAPGAILPLIGLAALGSFYAVSGHEDQTRSLRTQLENSRFAGKQCLDNTVYDPERTNGPRPTISEDITGTIIDEPANRSLDSASIAFTYIGKQIVPTNPSQITLYTNCNIK